MANPVKTLAGEKCLIQIGNGATPELFTHPCMINGDRAFTMSADVTEINVIDCDDPTAPGFKEIYKDGMKIEVTGAGVLHTPDLKSWVLWSWVDVAKNVRIKFDVAGALGGGYIAVPMKLITFGNNSPRKNNTNVDLSLHSHGTPVWVDNP